MENDRLKSDTHKYDAIIELPHYQSKTRPHMSVHERASQFSAFAPLSGHGEAIRETEERVERQVEEAQRDTSGYWDGC